MVPVVLDSARVKIAVVGEGREALSRLRFLRAHKAKPRAVYAPKARGTLASEAGKALVRRLPSREEIAAVDVLFIGGLDAGRVARLTDDARAVKTLVNVQDKGEESGFHVPASVRRGALLITVSTDGASPGLARRLKDRLSAAFGPEWGARVSQIARARAAWRKKGLDMEALKRETDRYIDEKGWLS